MWNKSVLIGQVPAKFQQNLCRNLCNCRWKRELIWAGMSTCHCRIFCSRRAGNRFNAIPHARGQQGMYYNLIMRLLCKHWLSLLVFRPVPNARAPPVTVQGVRCKIRAVAINMSADPKNVFHLLQRCNSISTSNIEPVQGKMKCRWGLMTTRNYSGQTRQL